MISDILKSLQKINEHILRENTGCSHALALKMRLTDRTLFAHIKLMKELGCPIWYCRKKKTYMYTSAGSFSIGFKKLSEELSGSHLSYDERRRIGA